MGWRPLSDVLRSEWSLVRAYPRLALAFFGVLFVPALYAWICLYAMWDPASHTRALPAGLVNLDTGASYRSQELNLGRQVLDAIERDAHFAYRRYSDPAAARQEVRAGRLAFVLEIPADFSRQALPGQAPGAAKLTLYTSEGNHYASAAFARQFAPEVAQQVNTMLAEARWDLVLSSAAGSQRNLETLRGALAELHRSSGEFRAGLVRAQEGSAQLTGGTLSATESAARLRQGTAQVADGIQQASSSLRQVAGPLRSLEARPPSEAEVTALRQGLRSQVDGQRELLRGLEGLAGGSRQLESGVEQFKSSAEDIPLFGGRVSEGMAPLVEGTRQMAGGLERARDGQTRLLQGALRLEDGVGALIEGSLRAGQALQGLPGRLPDDGRLLAPQWMIQRANGGRSVPQIFIDGKHVGGCDDLYALEAQGKLDPLLKGAA